MLQSSINVIKLFHNCNLLSVLYSTYRVLYLENNTDNNVYCHMHFMISLL